MLILKRLISNTAGVYGVFMHDLKIVCHTLELPWLGNIQNKSCIPTGEYSVIKSQSPKYGDCFYIKNVPGRDGILIHPGNSLRDTRGCILPGIDVSDIGLVSSRMAMDRLRARLPSKFQLVIQ